MDYYIERTNKERAIATYKDVRRTLKERFDGERDIHIKLNSQCVLDGLNKVIMLKEKELNKYIQTQNLEENK